MSGGGYTLYRHELAQSRRIDKLTTEMNKLDGEITLLQHRGDESIDWPLHTYNYLAIGNSITIHGYADYWWDDDRGMAASTDDNDYVHRVVKALEDTYGEVSSHSYGFSSWETNGYDRAEFLELLDPYLSEEIDLITIQLGENASDLSTWEADWSELLRYVQEKAPDARIIVVGDFWSKEDRDEVKKNAAVAMGITYVSLDGIKDNEEYYAGLGTEVEGSDGLMHVIEHEGVARHPGDKGMEAIAERIIASI